jgi:phenylalanine-4-hydroxylase
MAISHTINTPWGVAVPDAYCRVEAVALESKEEISFHVRHYKAPDGVPFFTEQVLHCHYDIDGTNPIKQAYDHLKTLPEFAGATDC